MNSTTTPIYRPIFRVTRRRFRPATMSHFHPRHFAIPGGGL